MNRSSERTGFRDVLRTHKKYGSTGSDDIIRRTDYFQKHIVQRSDTLQGIALKYGVSMEHIKRANKLWTSDSLFLREHLYIPLPSNPLFRVAIEDVCRRPQDVGASNTTSDGAAMMEPVPLTPESESSLNFDKSDQTASDLLKRIDASLSATKNRVSTLGRSSEFVEELPRSSGTTRYRNGMLSHSVSAGHVSDVPVACVRSSTRQRLAQTQDDIFQL